MADDIPTADRNVIYACIYLHMYACIRADLKCLNSKGFEKQGRTLCLISTKSVHRANFGGSKIDFEK